MIIVVLDIVMSRPACGAYTFTEHRHSKFPDLRALILMDTNNDSSVIGGFGGSLMDWWIGLDLDPGETDSMHISGCTPWEEFNAATSIATNVRIPISESLQAASVNGKFQQHNRNACEKYNDSDDDEWFLGVDKKRNVYMKHC